MALVDDFEGAQKRARQLRSRPSNDALLELYSLFKQATVGDAESKRPGLLDPMGRAKFDAWEKRRGLDRDSAMRAYVALVERLVSADR